MKIIKIPNNIVVKSIPPLVLPFKDFLKSTVEGGTIFGSGIKNIRAGLNLLKKIEEIKPQQETIEFSDNEYELLKIAMNQVEWHPRVAQSIISFFELFEL